MARALHERIRVEECELLFPLLRSLLPPRPLVLEIGCGNGVQSVELAKFCRVVAVDPSVKPRRAGGVTWMCARAERLPFTNATFDLVYSSSVIEHLEDVAAVMAELSRVARPDALHVHTVPTHVWKVFSVGTHYGLLGGAVWRRLRGGRRRHRERADLSEWREAVRQSPWRRMWPRIHGTSASNLAELHAFRASSWRSLFARHGFDVFAAHPLLCYAPPELPFVPPNRIGARLGLASSVAFMMSARPAFSPTPRHVASLPTIPGIRLGRQRRTPDFSD